MSRLAKSFALFLSFVGLLGSATSANAALCNSSAAGGNWNLAASWAAPCNVVGGPTALDDVTILNGATVTVNAAGLAAKSVTIAAGNANTTLTFAAASSLAVTNDIVINAPTANNRSKRITVLTGALTVGGNVTLTGGTGATRDALLSASTGSITINGGLTVNATVATSSTVQLTDAGSVTVNGAAGVANGDRVIIGTGTFNVANAAATFANSNAAIVAATSVSTGTLNVAGNLTNGNTGTNTGIDTITLSSTGTITVGGTLTNNTGTTNGTITTSTTGNINTNGDFTNNGIFTHTAAGILNIGGNFSNSGTFNSGTGTVTFNGTAAQALGGTAVTTFNNLVIANTAAAVSANTNFNTNGTLTVNANAVLSPVAAVLTGGTGTLTGSGTVQVTRTAATANFASQYTITTKTLTNLTVDFAGVGATQTLDALTYGSATGGGLKVSNASGVSLTANTTVAGTLTLAGGVVNAGAFTLISSSDCTTKVVRTGGHVAGLLQLSFPTGAPNCTFHVGDATAYRPINASFASVTAAGSLIGSASQAAGEHPNIATSGLDSTKDVNRYWTLNNPVGGTIAYTTYTATINFINPTDFDAGATPASFEIERWDGAAWNVTTLGAATSTNTSASGLPSFVANSSNSFAVGEKNPPPTVVSINRLDTSPTSASTVRWTVTFSKSVTGVDATPFSLAASGVSGAYITSVTGSGTTWTVTADTGSGSGTLRLDQTGPGSVVPTLSGTFNTGEVYTITAPTALADYRFDEGSAGTVIDSSGNSLSGTLNGGVTVGGTGKICTGYNFNGTNAFVSVPNNALLNQTQITVAAWVRHNATTIKNWEAILAKGDSAYRMHLNGGCSINGINTLGGISFAINGGCATADANSGIVPVAGTWYHVVGTYDGATIKVYVNGALQASGAYAGTIASNTFPLYIGENAQQTGRYWSGDIDEVKIFNTALSAAKISAGYANENAGNNWDGTARVCPVYAPDHLEIQSSGSGLTCAASTLTIKACTDAAIPCAIPYTLGVSGTLSATGAGMTVNWDGTTGGAAGAGFAIPNGGSSVTKNVQVATAGSVTFGISSPSPLPINGTSCNFGTNPGNNNCVFTANTAGFIFSDSATGNTAYTIPALTSGTAQNTDNLLWLRAVQASTANAAVCTPTIISQTVAVDMGYTCNNPAACQAGNLGVINGTAIAPAGTPVSLAFDANGSAKITSVRYDDVGEITLTANKTITPFGGGTAVTLNGNSNAFVVKPAGFVISGIKCSTIDAANCGAGALAMPTSGDNPAAAAAAGVTFIRAGHPFTATVTAKNALGNTTKNYGQETTSESVKLTPALVAGLGLTNNPAIRNVRKGSITAGTTALTVADSADFVVGNRILVAGAGVAGAILVTTVAAVPNATTITLANAASTTVAGTSVQHGFSSGALIESDFAWDEVGIIKLTPSVGDGDYLGAGDASGTQTGNIGRFYAAKFALSPGGVIANRTDLAGCTVAGCGSFTYMGEQMSAVFTLTAQAVDGTTTLQNYNWSATPANQFAKLNPMAAVTAGTGGPLDMGAVDSAATRTPFPPCGVVPAHSCLTPAQASAGTFASGVANITVPFTIYRGNAAVGPYAVLDIGVAPQDSDGVAMPIAAYDLDTVNVVAGANNHAKVGRTEARYGRMKLSNAHGSELLNLPIAMEAQYWQGQFWAQNNSDDATAIVQNNIKLTTISGPAATISGVIKDAAGKWRIVLGKQAAPGGSSVCVDLDVGATGDMTCVAAMPLSMPYLQTGAAFDKDPVSRATFGVYKGNNEFIYLREAY